MSLVFPVVIVVASTLENRSHNSSFEYETQDGETQNRNCLREVNTTGAPSVSESNNNCFS